MTERPRERGESRVPSRGSARQAAGNASSRNAASKRRSKGSLQGAGALLAGLGERLRRAGPIGILVLVLGLAGGVLALVAEQSVIYEIEVKTASCEDLASLDLRDECETKGYEQHSRALTLLGLLALLLALAAGVKRSRPAAAAMALIGLVILAIAILGDLPDTDETGQIGVNFDEARAVRGPGLTLEIVAGALLVLAGLLGSLVRRRR